jgi:hypothetical protein
VPFADIKRSSNQKRSARTRPYSVRKIQRNTSVSNEAIDVDVKHPSRHIHGVARNLLRKGEARWSRCAFVINSTPTRLLASEIISRTSNALSNAAAARTVGCFLPTDFAGPTDEAIWLIDLPSMAAYETYRQVLADDPEHKTNVARLQESGAGVAMTRSFIQRVAAK